MISLFHQIGWLWGCVSYLVIGIVIASVVVRIADQSYALDYASDDFCVNALRVLL